MFLFRKNICFERIFSSKKIDSFKEKRKSNAIDKDKNRSSLQKKHIIQQTNISINIKFLEFVIISIVIITRRRDHA